MESSRTEYPAMLDTLEPDRAVDVLNSRVKHISTLNAQMADWLAERRRIEETYVTNLRKLSARQPPDESSDLGVFSTPWQKITGSVALLAESHHMLASRIEADVERPLRNFVNENREMKNLSTMQGNLQSLAKDYDTAQKKAERLNTRTGKTDSNKIANASSDFDNASSQWTSQAPYVFEALQAMDESRINQLRDTLTQYETLEVDLVERNRKTAENTLNSLLNVETSNEIRNFASTSTGGASRRRSSAVRGSRSGPSAGPGAAIIPSRTLAPPPAREDALDRQRSPSVGEEKKSRLSGLKRLGTVMSRRKSTQPAYDRRQPARAGASSSNLGANVMTNGEQATSSRAREVDPMADVAPPPGSPPRSRANRPSGPPQTFSDISNTPQLQEPLQPGITEPTEELPVRTSSRELMDTSPPPAIDPITQAQQESASFGESTSSIPTRATLRDTPIAEDQQSSEAARASTLAQLRASAAEPRRSSTQRGRRDGRYSAFIPTNQAPIMESQSTQATAGNESSRAVSNPMTSPKPLTSPTMDSPSAQQPSSSSFFNTPFIAGLQQGQPQSPRSVSTAPTQPQHAVQSSTSSSNLAPRPSTTEADPTASDTGSIRSARSTSTATAAMTQHPALNQPGLNTSIIETISAWQDHGSVTRAVIIGELALASIVDLSNPNSPSAGSSTDTIRLENFSALEKVAPNPAVVRQLGSSAGDRQGEYSLDLTAVPRTTIAFKYQVRVDPTTLGAQAPLILTPAWKIEPNQASVILSYGPNAAITEPVTLTNVLLAIHLEGRASSCMSRPVGTFSRERNIVYWKMDEMTLTPRAAPQKLLARFATEEEARAGNVEARWEVSGQVKGLGSGLGVSRLDVKEDDPFADSDEARGDFVDVATVRKTVSGTYVAT